VSDAPEGAPMIGRRACIVVAMLSCMFGVAASASAECAWVLWEQTPLPLGGMGIFARGEWNSRSECEDERARKEQLPVPYRSAVYICLPDTVDPRGPEDTDPPVLVPLGHDGGRPVVDPRGPRGSERDPLAHESEEMQFAVSDLAL